VEFGYSNHVMRQGMERAKEKRLVNCNIKILDQFDVQFIYDLCLYLKRWNVF